MKMEVYTPDEIDKVIHVLETIQDGLGIEDPYVLYDMIQEAINVLAQEDSE